MINRLRKEINGFFVGKADVVDDVLVRLLSGGPLYDEALHRISGKGVGDHTHT